MNIVQNFITNNPCYKQNQTIVPKGLMLHSVGCAQSKAYVFTRSWNKSNAKVAVHAVIDANSGDVYQCLPWTLRGWHAGGEANNSYIGVEMCESDGIKYTKGAKFEVIDLAKAQKQAKIAYESAVELFATLCKNYNLTAANIISHKEGHEKGIASNHVDPEHYWQQLKLPYSMDTFRSDVLKKLSVVIGPAPTNVPATFDKKNGQVIWNVLKSAGFSNTGTAGIMGNLVAESGLRPDNLQNSFNKKLGLSDEEYTARVDSGAYPQASFVHDGAGYGLAQWTFRTRKEGLYKYCKQKGVSIANLEAQLEWLVAEISSSKMLSEKLKMNLSLVEATNLVLTKYEKPTDMSQKVLSKRLTFAQECYNMYMTEHLFRVRQNWTAVNTQKGAFRDLTNAVNLAKKYGYNVYDEVGNLVFKS